jgi:hypothetical protein
MTGKFFADKIMLLMILSNLILKIESSGNSTPKPIPTNKKRSETLSEAQFTKDSVAIQTKSILIFHL